MHSVFLIVFCAIPLLVTRFIRRQYKYVLMDNVEISILYHFAKFSFISHFFHHVFFKCIKTVKNVASDFGFA